MSKAILLVLLVGVLLAGCINNQGNLSGGNQATTTASATAQDLSAYASPAPEPSAEYESTQAGSVKTTMRTDSKSKAVLIYDKDTREAQYTVDIFLEDESAVESLTNIDAEDVGKNGTENFITTLIVGTLCHAPATIYLNANNKTFYDQAANGSFSAQEIQQHYEQAKKDFRLNDAEFASMKIKLVKIRYVSMKTKDVAAECTATPDGEYTFNGKPYSLTG